MSAPIVATESLIKALSRFGMWPFFCMKPALNDNPINVDILSKRSTIVMENKTPTMPIVIMLLKSNWKMVSVGKNLKLLENRSCKPSNGVAPKINNSRAATKRMAISIAKRTPFAERTAAVRIPKLSDRLPVLLNLQVRLRLQDWQPRSRHSLNR